MTQKEFDKLVKQLNDYSLDIMANKRPEYTNENEDVLNNFKTTAERLETSELKVCDNTSRRLILTTNS